MTTTSACHLLFIGPFKNYPQITVYHPKDQGHPFANIGWTGWIGSITGMYAHIRTMSVYIRTCMYSSTTASAYIGTKLSILEWGYNSDSFPSHNVQYWKADGKLVRVTTQNWSSANTEISHYHWSPGISSQKMAISEIGVTFPDDSFGKESRFGTPFTVS